MTNDIIDGIVQALKAEYPDIPVYDETVSQGIVEPSFSVRCFHPQRRLFRGDRYYQEDLYEVVYFPPQENRYRNSNDVVENLFYCLEYLTLPDGKIRGRNMDAHMDDDFTVIFTVKYSDFLYYERKEEKPAFAEVQIGIRTSGTIPEYGYPLLEDESEKTLTDEYAIPIEDNEKVLIRGG